MREISICIVCFLLCFSAKLTGQIYRVSADNVVRTSYSPTDSIFIFNAKGNFIPSGSLMAKAPGGVAADFQWSRYNPDGSGSWIPVKSETNTLSSVISGLQSGGYKVHITASGTDAEFIAWVFVNTMSVKLDKESTGFVKYFSSTCDYLDLKVTSTPALFTYYNPSTNESIVLANQLHYKWTAVPAVEIYEVDTFKNIRFRKERLPLDTTLFFVTVSDNFRLIKHDSVWYPPILTKAKFDTAKVNYLVDKQYSAPVNIWFKNQSKNASKYHWNFGDGDTLERTDSAVIEHTYRLSNKTYDVRLVTESDQGCIDSIKMAIEVAPAQVGTTGQYQVPNVFTPNGDGSNDYFYFKSISIQSFKFSIFSRTGKKVYEYIGSSSDLSTGHWKGWDGKINGDDASEGIYYYVLEVMAFEQQSDPQKIHKDGVYKGFFYLFR